MAKAREVVEIETKPRLVHEDELARHAQLELSLGAEELLALRSEIGQRLLDGRVLDRIQFDGAQRTVRAENEQAPGLPNERVAGGVAPRVWGRGGCARTRHAVPDGPRSALFTALRTTMSFSLDA